MWKIKSNGWKKKSELEGEKVTRRRQEKGKCDWIIIGGRKGSRCARKRRGKEEEKEEQEQRETRRRKRR